MASDGLNIDNLQIEITAEASAAVEAINKLARSVRTLSKIELDASNIAAFVEEIAALKEEGDGIGVIAKNLNDLAKATSKLQAPSGLAATMQSLISASASAEDSLFNAKPLSFKGGTFENFIGQIKELDAVGKEITGLVNISAKLTEIATSASQIKGAGASIRELAKALTDVNDEGTSTSASAEQIEILGDTASRTATRLQAFISTVSRVGKSIGTFFAPLTNKIKEFTSTIEGMYASFKRVAIMRAFRAAIRAIAAGLKEGLDMFVAWDKESNGSMAGAANAVDSVKTAVTNLKGALGALLGGIVTQVAPIVTTVIGWLTDIVYFIQQISMALKGLGDYYKYVGGQTDELTKSTNKATGAAKELQKVLFGFDELNVLPSKNGGGGGTGIINNGTLDAAYQLQPSGWLTGIVEEVEKFNFKSKAEKIIAGITFAARDGLEWIGEHITKPIIDWVGKAVKWVVALPVALPKILSSLWQAIQTHFFDPLRQKWDALKTTIGLIIEYITNPFEWNTRGWERLVNNIVSVWADANKQMGDETEKTASVANENYFKAEQRGIESIKTVAKAFDDIGVPDLKVNLALDEKSENYLVYLLKQFLKSLQTYASKNGYIDIPVVYSTSRNTGNGYDMSRFDKKISYAAMASGGVPDVGTLFYAGEAGAEVVANMGHSTGVMNVSQMQEAVANGNIEVVNAVYAMANMVAGAVNNKNFDVYMDTQKVGQSVSRYQYNQARRGVPQGAI